MRAFTAILGLTLASLTTLSYPPPLQAEDTLESASPPLADRKEPQARTEGGLVWAVKSATTTIYLAGTVHLLRESDYPIPDVYDEVYDIADELVFEVDPHELFDISFVRDLRSRIRLPEGSPLSDRFSEPTVEAIHRYLQKHSLAPDLLDRFSSGLIYLTLFELEASQNGMRPGLGLESRYFYKNAMDEKPSRGLETVEYQLTLFDRLPTAALEEMILDSITGQAFFKENLDRLITAWREGDADRLATELAREFSDHPQVSETLLNERNANWLPLIETALNTPSTATFLLGSAHLVGDQGLVKLLSSKGYDVQRITDPVTRPQPSKPLQP